MNSATSRQIRNLLLVIGSGVFFALLVGSYFAFFFSPTGQYAISKTMLSPDLIKKLNYNDLNPKTGSNSLFAFDSIEFIYKDKKINVSEDAYAKLYALLSSDNSMGNSSKAIETLFTSNPPARLVINVKTENNATWLSTQKIFQEIQFVPNGDYYRVELREQNLGWAYYYHQQVFAQILDIMGIQL